MALADSSLSSSSSLEAARALLRAGADAGLKDLKGKTAAELARDKKRNEIADLIEKRL